MIYQALYGNYRVYARPLEMFLGEVDHLKYPKVAQRYRFELVSGGDAAEPVKEGGTAPAERMKEMEASVEPVKEGGTAPAERMEGMEASAGPVKEGGTAPAERMEGMEARTEPWEGRKKPTRAAFVTERRTEEQPRSERRAQFARQPKSAMVRKAPESPKKDGALTTEELLMAFYDAATYGRKYQILLQMEEGITDVMIDNMALVMDIVIPEGPLEKRYQELKRCVRTYEKYETGRG